ncbi:MAG TPA: aminoglycoside phosphotransferase family protein, partial [Thermoanaerobaculia bacterium]|nr:aminoglycoside phosphotransferase family protein [Thermoanaerobaculia bacterium]
MIPLPIDAVLGGLRSLLDGEEVSRAVGGALGRDDVVLEPRYMRYKPANRALVLYDARLAETRTCAVMTLALLRNSRKDARRPASLAIAERARSRCAVPDPIVFLESLGALVEWYPARTSIPGLVADLETLRRDLTRRGAPPGDGEAPELVSCKPERRAVLKWGDLYLKAYASPADFEIAASALGASARIPGVPTPRPVALYTADRLTVQTALPGCVPARAASQAEIGSLVAKLHAADPGSLPRFVAADHLDGARRTLAHLKALVPERLPALERITGRIEPDGLPEPLVPSHGDLHAAQVIATRDGPGLVDFDHVCLAEPAYDLATFAAHLVDGASGSLEKAHA